MFYNSLDPKDTYWFHHQLVEDKSFVSLEQFVVAVIRNDDSVNEKNIHTSETRENTLSYLLPLLKEGKLKVGRDGFKLSNGDYTVEEWKISPEEIIEKIRMEWNQCVDEVNKNSGAYEGSILFTLPENSWPIFSPIPK